MRVLAVAVLAVALLPSCATIMQGEHATVRFTTVPQGAAFTVTDEHGALAASGTTPGFAVLPRGEGWFDALRYTVDFELEGYIPHSVSVKSSPSGWYVLGNVIFGDFIGWLLVDPASGAMWRIHHVEDVELVPIESEPAAEPAAAP